jgi:hypothetical protein
MLDGINLEKQNQKVKQDDNKVTNSGEKFSK